MGANTPDEGKKIKITDIKNEKDEDILNKLKNTGDLSKDEKDFIIDYLMNKYKNFVKSKANQYFLTGAEKDDVLQEGMIGLYKAIRDFDAKKIFSFMAFADICIMRQIITAVKSSTSKKNIPMNSYISYNKSEDDEHSDATISKIFSDKSGANPEEIFLSNEQFVNLRGKIKECLSDFESKVLLSYLDGESYIEMSTKLNVSLKSVDNALQRIKKKIEKIMREENK